jgi:surface antigen
LSDPNEESLNRVPENLDSASLASYVSLESEILVASNITESRDTLLIQETVAPIQADIVDKPQNTVVGGSSREIKEYISVEGDTIQSVADNFAVSADTIRWANEISGDSLNVGTKLRILPVTGVVVDAKRGDNAKSIAEQTGSSAEEVAAFNDISADAEISEKTQIIVPNGTPRKVPQLTSLPGTSRGYGPTPNPVFTGGNTYTRGYCTWHAANRRAQIGRPIPNRMGNAISWARAAASAGYSVDGNPRSGDVLYHRNIGGAGHVAFVESVNDDGSLSVSDMNYPSWGRVTRRTVPAGDLGKYLFIH